MKPANSLIGSYETATSRKFRQRFYMAVTAILLFLLVSCAGERDRSPGFAAQALQSMAEFLFGATCGDFYLDDMSSTFSYSLDSVTAGETTGLSVFMTFPNEVTMPILTTYQVVITVPPDFTFLGFDALGTGIADSIGAWDFDFVNPDGVFDNPDFTIVHRGINSTSAYSDQDDSGDFTPGIDPTADYTMGGGGEHIITLILPDGGIEQDTNGLCSYFPFDARYTLLDGILRLPSTPGDYSISIAATSVDLDTGNATDNVLPDPLTYADSFVVAVPEPGATQLAVASLATLLVMAAGRRARRRE
jgi:hypothetical protein